MHKLYLNNIQIGNYSGREEVSKRLEEMKVQNRLVVKSTKWIGNSCFVRT